MKSTGAPFRPRTLPSLLALTLALAFSFTLHGAPKPPVPDFTRGNPKGESHDWNLGPTGMRGWMWGSNLQTTDARQILVTKVDKGSPADGLVEVGDVILGVGGAPFSGDARIQFGQAVTRAEETGTLEILRWRDGKRKTVRLKLEILGSYGPTSPYDCPKAKRIVANGCRVIADHGIGRGIPGHLNALALLAAGALEHEGLLTDYAHKVAASSPGGLKSWSTSYANLFLTEYYLATRDETVLPAIRKFTMAIAEGQSGVGTWGHGFADPKVNILGGYGAMNQCALTCTLSMALARKCGIDDPVVDRALKRAERFFSFYIGKGAIPYGDHIPWMDHDNNGKSSAAAVMFDLLGNNEGTVFFARMAAASYAEREPGHTGNFFSYAWAGPGVCRAGPRAVAAFMKEQRWYYDLARRWNGAFDYQGGASSGGGEHKYGGWDCTGAFLLCYTLPLAKTHVTGKNGREALHTRECVEDIIDAGRDWSWWTRKDSYAGKSTRELLVCLRSWSPAVRHRAARALGTREDVNVKTLDRMLQDGDATTLYGVCEGLEQLGSRAAPAVPELRRLLRREDTWLRIRACMALAAIGDAARPAVPDMLSLAISNDPNDPREFMQRYLAFTLFYRGGAWGKRGLLSQSLDGVDRKLLYPAIRRLLQNEDGRARGALESVYRNLGYEELQSLLPEITTAIRTPSPSGVMFTDGIRTAGLKLLAKNTHRDGLPLAFEILGLDRWGKNNRIRACLDIVREYGPEAKSVLPQLRELKQQLEQHREKKMMAPHIETIDKIIAALE